MLKHGCTFTRMGTVGLENRPTAHCHLSYPATVAAFIVTTWLVSFCYHKCKKKPEGDLKKEEFHGELNEDYVGTLTFFSWTNNLICQSTDKLICLSVNLQAYLFFAVQLDTIRWCWKREAHTLEFKNITPQFGQQGHFISIRYGYWPKITHLQCSCSSLDQHVRRCLPIEQYSRLKVYIYIYILNIYFRTRLGRRPCKI